MLRKLAWYLPALLGLSVAGSSADVPASKVTTHAAPTALVGDAVVTDWEQFMGPNGDMTSPETPLALDFGSEGPKLLWEIEVGGGYAAPAVAGDRLVFFHRVGAQERVECVNALTGASLWTYGYESNYVDRYQFSNGPRCSPVIGDGRVYTHGAEGRLHCFELETGKLLWQRNTSTDYTVPQDHFGVGPTPLLYEGMLIVAVGAPKGPCVVALQADTGKEIWRAGKNWRGGYATPMVATLHGKPKILFFAGGDDDPPTGGLLGIEPATGRVAFEFPFRSRIYASVNASNPVVFGDQIFLSSSYKTGGVLIEVQADDSIKEVWRTKDFGAHFMTPIVRNGYLYGITGAGKHGTELTCLRMSDGKTMWSESPKWPTRIVQAGEPRTINMSVYRGTMLALTNGYLLLGGNGHLAFGQCTPDGFDEQSRTSLFLADETWTPPVLSRGLLYVCQNKPDKLNGTGTRLLCYSLRGE